MPSSVGSFGIMSERIPLPQGVKVSFEKFLRELDEWLEGAVVNRPRHNGNERDSHHHQDARNNQVGDCGSGS